MPELTSSSQDPVTQSIVGVTILLIFALLVLEKAHRVLVVMGAVALLWLVTYTTPYHAITFEATGRALDFNVIFLLAAMMTLVGVLKSTGVFEWAVARLMVRAEGRPLRAQRLVAWFTGVLSAVCDNVTTVVFMTPMATGLSRQLRVAPVVILLPMIMASNIGGTATLIGDPPNIMIGSGAHLSFLDFVVNLTVPIVLMMFALEWISRRYYRSGLAVVPSAGASAVAVPDIQDPRLLRWTLVITAVVFVGFFTHGWTGMPAAVPATIGAAAALIVQDVLYLRRHRPTAAERAHGLLDIIEREIEWPTLLFFTFLFIAVGAAVETGLIARLAEGLHWAVDTGASAMNLSPQGTLIFAALLILWVSGVLSALVDNIPFVAVAIPIVARLVATLNGDTQVLWWALALGACLGGNGSAVGASANVTTIGLAERSGERISFREFLRFGSRVTAMTLLMSSAFIASHVVLGQRMTLWIGLALIAIILLIRVVAPPAWEQMAERAVNR